MCQPQRSAGRLRPLKTPRITVVSEAPCLQATGQAKMEPTETKRTHSL